MAGLFFLYPFEKGDIVHLRKLHPCGGKTWDILRVGADVTLRCTTCGHLMIVTRRILEKSCTRVESSKDRNKPI